MTEEEAKKAKHINYFTRLRFNEKYNFIVKVLNKYVKLNNNLEIERFRSIQFWAPDKLDEIPFEIWFISNRRQKAKPIIDAFNLKLKNANFKQMHCVFYVERKDFDDLYLLCKLMET